MYLITFQLLILVFIQDQVSVILNYFQKAHILVANA